MAQMIDDNITKYEGEALVWDSIKKNLPDSVIAYFNREVDGRTYDFCLLLENMGVLIIEVKGWKPETVKVNTPDKIIISGYDEPQRSPRKQAYEYQYKLRNFFQKELGVTPLYFNMVCYPFIDSGKFNDLRLDLVSPENLTLLKEDISDPDRFKSKIDQAYDNVRNNHYDAMTDIVINKIRKYYEPNFKAVASEDVKNDYYYSKLRVFTDTISESEINSIVNEYFFGTKEILFVNNESNFRSIIQAINDKSEENNIRFIKQDIELGNDGSQDLGDFYKVFKIFNFELYLVESIEKLTSANIEVVEGNATEEEWDIIKGLANATDNNFNYNQYKIEHAPLDKNILVQAGAGTGKTYSMVSRIAFLCNRHKNPIKNIIDDIVLVTFTNDAAENMSSRIKQMFMNYYLLTGDNKYINYIEDVSLTQISTIHKFAMSILQKDPINSGFSTKFTISQNTLARRQFYQQHLNEYIQEKTEADSNFINTIPVPIYEFIKDLMAFADKLSDKSINIQDVSEDQIGTPSESFPFNEVIEKVIKPAEKDYHDLLNSYDEITIDDCLVLLHDMVKKSNKLSFINYKYIFIDEFQDTDNIQIEIFQELVKNMQNDCKLFVVGDLKQSIYRFRGATISAFDKLIGNRVDLWQKYTLNTNYRTDKRLLEAYDDRFQKWGESGYLIYSWDKDQLIGNVVFPDIKGELLKNVEYDSSIDNDFDNALLNLIEEKKEELEDKIANEDIKRGSKEATIAILTRSNWQIEHIIDVAQQRDIEIKTQAGGNLYKLPSTIDFYKLVNAISNPENIAYLVSLISSSYIHAKLDFNRLHGLSDEQKLASLTQYLNDFFDVEMRKSFQDIVKDAFEQPILNVLRKIYNALMPWKHYSIDEDEQHSYMANYEYLIEKIIQTTRVENITLDNVVNYLNIYVKTGQEEQPRKVTTNQPDVTVLCTTVHKSKGLEYGTVIIPYTYEDISYKKNTKLEVDWNNNKLSYFIQFGDSYEIHNSYYDKDVELEEQEKEETRVLYVAVTRAIRECIWLKDVNKQPDLSWNTLMEE